jgi:geranylgeranyl reductase family protein
MFASMKPREAQETYDVAVVGSGPGGSTAARCLAQEGLSVILFEKEELPRVKVCAGGIIPRVVAELPDEAKETIERNCYTAEVTEHAGGAHFLVRRDEPIVSTTMRNRFDFALVNAAGREGVHIASGCKVLELENRHESLVVRTSRGSFKCRFLVGADGALSTVARKAGFPGHGCLVPTLESEVRLEPSLFKRFQSAVRFDFGIVPRGYGWVFPKKDHLSIGVGQMRKGRIDLQKILESYLSFLGITNSAGFSKRGFVIPIIPRRDGFVKGRSILVGDAAGLVDPLTGEGISLAIRSARLAATALSKGQLIPNLVKKYYEEDLKKEILLDLKWGRLISGLAYDHLKVRSCLFRFCGQRICEAMTDIIFGHKTYRSVLKNPLTYLKLLLPVRK